MRPFVESIPAPNSPVTLLLKAKLKEAEDVRKSKELKDKKPKVGNSSKILIEEVSGRMRCKTLCECRVDVTVLFLHI